MDKVSISETDVVSMDRIAPGLVGLRILLVNLFAISIPNDGWILVDAGLPLSAEYTRHWCEQRFHGSSPRAILLTHGHFDHVGGLKSLAEAWDVPVYAHEAELPYITGKEKYPPPDPKVGGGLMSLLAPLYPRGPEDIGSRAQALPADGSVPELPAWKWIHTAGHTDGHVSYFREGDRTLIAGDAFCTTDQQSAIAIAEQRPELHGPPAYYTSDWDAAKRSVEKLAALHPITIVPGHGLPMSGADVPPKLEQLARRFDEVARPKQDRYVA
jgi:glyoxylase-like metal-dependent hydrolase (beta-lactamase superfamily II)